MVPRPLLPLLPFLLLLLAGLSSPGLATAQGTVRLEFTPPAVVFSTPGVLEFDAGWIDHSALVVSVLSRPFDRPWELRIQANDAAMGPGKPVSDLLWRVVGTGTWIPLTGVEAVVLQGQGDQDVALEFRLQLDWTTDPPGSYTAAMDFSVLRL